MDVTLGTLLLVVASSLAWAGLDSCRKALLSAVEPVPLLALLTLASVPPFALWVALSGTAGPATPQESLLRAAYLVPALGSVLLNLGANLAFMQAVRLSPLSLTIPLLSLTPVFATLLAIPLLGERPGLAGFGGVLLVVAGAFWLSRETAPPAASAGVAAPAGVAGEAAGSTSYWQALRREPGVPLMGVTALLWSLTIPLDKLAMRQSGAPRHALFLTAAVGLGFLLVLAARGRLRELAHVRRVPWLLALAVGVSVLALGLQLLALGQAWVGWVETLKRGIGNLAAVVMGRLAFGEALTARKVAAVLLMAAGVALLLG